MKKAVLILTFLAVTAIMGVLMTEAKGFTILSKTIKEGAFLQDEQIYNGFGCSGKNIAPDLEWKNPPVGTKSYTLIMHDPDAPMPGGWWHWIVANIPSSKTNFAKGEMVNSPSMLTKTSFGNPGYGGPCPPKGHGKHRYIFTVYALDVANISSKPEMTPVQIEALIKPHTLGKASLMGYYERK